MDQIMNQQIKGIADDESRKEKRREFSQDQPKDQINDRSDNQADRQWQGKSLFIAGVVVMDMVKPVGDISFIGGFMRMEKVSVHQVFDE